LEGLEDNICKTGDDEKSGVLLQLLFLSVVFCSLQAVAVSLHVGRK